MRYHLLVLSVLGALVAATQATAQSTSHEFWTEKSAATGTPLLASLGQSETPATPTATAATPDAAAPALPVGQFLLAHQDFAVTHHSEPVGAFRRKHKQ
jgi:hypothetical protein